MEARVEQGSFRDRRARVYRVGDTLYRCLDASALEDWRHLSRSELYRRSTESGEIVVTREVTADQAPAEFASGRWAGILVHEVLPFISYPYEWCFGQLKDAALFHLGLMVEALKEELILKDSSAYNIQWRGSRPVFIDVPSFERLNPGEPWVGYRQFCEMFLNPLVLAAHKGVRFQPWMRGRLDGIETRDLARLLSLRDLLRKGMFAHVYLHAVLQRSMKASDVTKTSLKQAGFRKEIVLANVRSLQRIVGGLSLGTSDSHWAQYAATHSYTDDDYRVKQGFVAEVVADRGWPLVWDLGCNTGDFSRIAAGRGSYVVAMDADEAAVGALYARGKADGERRILPLVMNLVDPSPSLGWRGQERRSLEARGLPDLVLALALVHHVVISAHVPLQEFVGWLAGLKAAVVLEFVSKQDEMVAVLLRNKEDLYSDYSQENLERCLGEAFDIQKRMALKGGLRTLYYATPKGVVQ